MQSVEDAREGSLIRIRAKPGSKSFLIKEVKDSYIKISLKSPPEKGKANKELVKGLSKIFKTRVKLISGKKSRTKIVLVKGMNSREVAKILLNNRP